MAQSRWPTESIPEFIGQTFFHKLLNRLPYKLKELEHLSSVTVNRSIYAISKVEDKLRCRQIFFKIWFGFFLNPLWQFLTGCWNKEPDNFTLVLIAANPLLDLVIILPWLFPVWIVVHKVILMISTRLYSCTLHSPVVSITRCRGSGFPWTLRRTENTFTLKNECKFKVSIFLTI